MVKNKCGLSGDAYNPNEIIRGLLFMHAFKTIRNVSSLTLVCHLEFPQLKFHIIWRDFGVAESERKP